MRVRLAQRSYAAQGLKAFPGCLAAPESPAVLLHRRNLVADCLVEIPAAESCPADLLRAPGHPRCLVPGKKLQRSKWPLANVKLRAQDDNVLAYQLQA